MNNDLHPHWQSTGDDDSVAAPRAAATPVSTGPVRVSITPATRLPAAIVGIAICTMVGFSVAGGWEALTAQLGGSGTSSAAASQNPAAPLPTVDVHITATGFEPSSVVVKPGQQITWFNDQSIPHILTSQTLRNGSGEYLNTPAIFPGARESFTVGPNEADHQHTITSTTDQTLVGTVIVSANGQPAASSSSKHPFGGGTDGVPLPSGQGSMSTHAVTSSKASSAKSSAKSSKAGTAVSKSSAGGASAVSVASTASSSAQNAAAGTTASSLSSAPLAPAPLDAQVFPSQHGSTLDTFAPTPITPEPLPAAADTYAPPDPEPLEQPHTGPGLWVVCAMSLGVLWVMMRKYFVAPVMSR